MNTQQQYQNGRDAYTDGEGIGCLAGRSASFERGFWDAHNDAADAQPEPECLDDHVGGCEGRVEYRPAMSPTGKSFPRCEAHFAARLVTQERISSTYGVPMFY